MDAKRLQDLLQGEDTQKLIDAVISDKRHQCDEHLYKQYNPIEHDIHDTNKRPKKLINKPNALTGDPEQTYVDVTRLSVPLQKKIVERAAAFLAGNPIELECNADDQPATDFLAVIQKIWEDNKLNYKTKRLVKLMGAETECAEIWYADEVDPDFWEGTIMKGALFTLRMRIIAKSLKDDLYPVFDAMDDLIAFGRGYKQYNEAGKLIDHFDLYTEDAIHHYNKPESEWQQLSLPEKNFFSKIPVIYYKQDQVEWADVQHMIDRLEKIISNHADTNDYNGSPIIKVQGEVTGFSTKGESGKVLQLANGADANYLTWDNAPESIKLEYNNLMSLIFDLTDTPQFSWEQLRGLGDLSGVALQMLFLNAHLKAADKEEIFGECIQRRINFLKSGIVSIKPALKGQQKLSIKPKFKYYMPNNDVEKVDMLTTAVSAGFLSIESAAEQSPTTTDADVEKTRLKDEQQQQQARTAGNIANEFNTGQ